MGSHHIALLNGKILTDLSFNSSLITPLKRKYAFWTIKKIYRVVPFLSFAANECFLVLTSNWSNNDNDSTDLKQ